LFPASTNGRPVSAASFSQTRRANCGCVLELRHVPGELLPERERRRVLQVGAADLDDAGESLAFLRQRSAQRFEGWEEIVLDGRRRREVHRRRKDVVRRLAQVDVVVRMHSPVRAALAAEQFGGAIGEHLVQVHVGLGTGTGLPDHQRKFHVVFAGDDLVRRFDDGPRFLFVQNAEFGIDQCAGALDARQRMNQLRRHALAGDAEILQAALGLRSPQPVRGDFDLAERVFLYPGFHI
jgi:hypothetical protein